MLYQLFEGPEPIFYEALQKDKLVVDIYLQMLTKAEESLSFQSLVLRNPKDFKPLLSLKSFLPYLESTIKKPFSLNSLI